MRIFLSIFILFCLNGYSQKIEIKEDTIKWFSDKQYSLLSELGNVWITTNNTTFKDVIITGIDSKSQTVTFLINSTVKTIKTSGITRVTPGSKFVHFLQFKDNLPVISKIEGIDYYVYLGDPKYRRFTYHEFERSVENSVSDTLKQYPAIKTQADTSTKTTLVNVADFIMNPVINNNEPCDSILLPNRKILLVKIIGIDRKIILYKRLDLMNGPRYRIPRRKSIIYRRENTTTIDFSNDTTAGL